MNTTHRKSGSWWCCDADYPNHDANCLSAENNITRRQCGHEWRNNDFTCMDCVERGISDLKTELAFYFGAYHGTINHRLNASECMENECVRVRNLLK